jgi:hypothetical protein
MKTEFDLIYKTPTLKSQEIQSLMNNCESDSEIYDETIQHQFEISLLEKDLEIKDGIIARKESETECEKIKNELLELKLQNVSMK